ncbi:MAG TPA: CYTH domain-containing protein [Candidatus Limnocylindrales bacterium]|nr:CYTH domain-containing protein [Candidatus Limnocylindrales bacterium]
MSGDVEVEVKLGVTDPDAIRQLIEQAEPASLAGFEAAGPLHEDAILDRYFDTADGRLEAAGARARVRTGVGAPLLAIKWHGVDTGRVTARRELEGPAGAGLDLAGWPDSAARRELERLTRGEPIVEIARLRQRRLARLIRRGATSVELSLDALEALAGEDLAATRNELEAELKAGGAGPLHELAAVLASLSATGPATGSKLGFALGALRAPGSGPAGPAPRRDPG